jgi:hypothetical protein
MATSARISLSPAVGGLRLAPADWRKALPTIGLCILGVTILIVLVDCVLFRATLPASYVAFFADLTPPSVRIATYMALSGIDEMEYRLVLMTALVVAGGLFWRDADGDIPACVFVAAILLSQIAYVLLKLPAPHGAVDVLYDALRYYAVGSVWGWLYWRHGWLSAVAGHAGTHLVLQPALLVLLG